jgi:hypothetical protein
MSMSNISRLRLLPCSGPLARGFVLFFFLSTSPYYGRTSTITTAHGWSAEWINLSKQQSQQTYQDIQPPRSGHAAFALDDKVYVFGGYAEDENKSNSRYPTNDLWEFDTTMSSQNWKCVHAPQVWSEEDTTTTSTSTSTSTTASSTPALPSSTVFVPQQRLAAAAASLSNKGILLGGWDSQLAGTGGVILKDISLLTMNNNNNNKDDDDDDNEDTTTNEGGTRTTSWKWESSAVDLGGPTSRLVAVPISDTTLVVHNHRCVDHVLLVTVVPGEKNEEDITTVQRQATTGRAPSPRGLHAATYLPKQDKVLVFGGAAQSGTMENDVFVLDCRTWQWSQVQTTSTTTTGSGSGDNDEQPSPRASPCLVTLVDDDDDDADDDDDDTTTTTTCLLFGGADRSLDAQGVPLHGCDDLWLLHLDCDDTNEEQDDSSTTTASAARWERLIPSTEVVPPGRNAATLTPLSSDNKATDSSSSASSQSFLLVGGWYPFQTTHADTYLLNVSNK